MPDAPSPSLVHRSPDRALWAVAWPVAVMGWLRTGYLLTDAWFVGRLGDDALSALGAASFGWWMVMLVAEIPAVGVHARVAQHTGAGRPDRVVHTLVQGLWVALAMAVVLLAMLALVPVYLHTVGLEPGSAPFALGGEFLRASLLGGVVFSLNAVVSGTFRGLGETRAALAITVLGFVANGVLDPLLIGAFGIAGAAWATVAGNALGAAIGLAWLSSRGYAPRLTRPDAQELRQVVAIGAPVSARGIAFSMVYVLLGRMIVQFGEIQMAGLAVGHRLENVAYHVAVAFEVGAATLVGQHLGAGDIAAARRMADRAAAWCAGTMVPLGVLLFVGAPTFLSWFAESPEAVAAGTAYVRLQAVVAVWMALECVYGGAFAGASDTVPPFWIVTLGTLIRVPLAWVLAFPLGLGVQGIWAAIALSTALKGVVSAVWFRRGGWIRRWPASLPGERSRGVPDPS